MRANVIAQLAWYKPRSAKAAGFYTCEHIAGLPAAKASDIVHFAECFGDMAFGWNFAVSMQDQPLPFPAILRGDDLYIWRAYNYLKGKPDAVIDGAVMLNTSLTGNTRNIINSLLIAEDVDCAYVASRLKLPLEHVKAYEKLFFNILDRKQDHAFISNLVFPDGRIVEAFESYLETTGISALMLKAGFLHGKTHVLFNAGLGKNPYASRDAIEGAKALDGMFMADGCLYASLGWLHQSKNAMPISNARLSMQATKMGNNTMETMSGELSLGDTMKEQIVQLSKLKADASNLALAIDVPVITATPSS